MTEPTSMPEPAVPGRVPGEAPPPVGLDALADEILPALIARLRASRLGELEVRSDGWRVRLRRDVRGGGRAGVGIPSAGGGSGDEADEPVVGVARSPAVGYFSPVPRLAVGLDVQAGDVLGFIDMLGISQEVTAPLAGIVRIVLAESGQAVEYGQALVEVDPMAGDGADDAEQAPISTAAEAPTDEASAPGTQPDGPALEP